MNSIVLDLQNEVTKPNCDILGILRKAHLIAVKLNLSEFDRWITCELNGYKSVDTIPDYRVVRGVLKAFNPYRGWIPAIITDKKIEDSICIRRIPNSLSEIISLCNQSENGLIAEFTGEQTDMLDKLFDSPLPSRYTVHLSNPAVGDIIEKVKNAVLEWTIKLEAEGILGEGMQFSSAEKETAKSIPQTINYYYYGNVINAPVEHSAIVSGSDNHLEFTYEKAREITSDIEMGLKDDKLSTEDQATAMEMLAEIKEKISQMGVRTKSWTTHTAKPRLFLYSIGLILLRDTLILLSLYHKRYSLRIVLNSWMDTFVQSRQ